MSLLSNYVVSSHEASEEGTYKPAKHTGSQLDRVCRLEVTYLR
jgi:hypothetical protein